VGNSGSLLGARRGALIDSHDSVVRFNAAPSGGVWAEDVGSKATLRILSSWVAKMRTWHPNDTRATATNGTLLYCMANWVGGCMRRGTAPPASGQPRRWLINPSFVRHVRATLMRTHPPTKHTALPSAGLLGVAMALRSCDHVTLVGFGNVSASTALSTEEARSTSPGRTTSAERVTGACEHYYECALSGGRLAAEARYFSASHPSNPGTRL
jgi:hypothetical protein